MASEPCNLARIIGAMTSGATSLSYYLTEHSEVVACRLKEPNIFGNDADGCRLVSPVPSSLMNRDADSHRSNVDSFLSNFHSTYSGYWPNME